VTIVSRPPGLQASGMVKIHAAIGAATDAINGLSGADRKMRLAQEMTQAPLIIPLMNITAGAGSVGSTDNSGPFSGYYWSVRRIQIQGFTAGSVISYRNGELAGTNNGGTLIGTPEVVAPFPQAGVFTFGRGELLLNPNDWLTWVASGITLATGYGGVQIQGVADSFPSWLLPEYLM
jgi:hypothetical protein